EDIVTTRNVRDEDQLPHDVVVHRATSGFDQVTDLPIHGERLLVHALTAFDPAWTVRRDPCHKQLITDLNAARERLAWRLRDVWALTRRFTGLLRADSWNAIHGLASSLPFGPRGRSCRCGQA